MEETAVVLTIDTGSLRDLFLPSLARGAAALEYIDSLLLAAVGKPDEVELLAHTYCALLVTHCDRVEVVRSRGGLLLIGGEF